MLNAKCCLQPRSGSPLNTTRLEQTLATSGCRSDGEDGCPQVYKLPATCTRLYDRTAALGSMYGGLASGQTWGSYDCVVCWMRGRLGARSQERI